jgi:polyisoprenoid-binding protein YceI
MKIFSLLIPVLVLSLAACQTTSLTPEEQAAPQVSDTAFTGTRTTVDTKASVLSFVGESSVVNHEGKFNAFTVTLIPNAQTPADFTQATLNVSVDLTSVETDSKGLDGHLQKEDFFDTAAYPTATFTSTSIVSGDLTVKGATKSAMMEASVTDDALLGALAFPRKDFGVGNDSYGDKLLKETVPVMVKVMFQ